MLTNLIASFCNTFLGRYIENLDTSQLHFSLLQGKAELRNVSLKKNALANLGLPLAIHSGFVGKVFIDIPVIHMTSQPWLVSFEQIYLVVGPKKNEQSDTSKEPPEFDEDLESFKQKKAALDLMEAEWRSNMGFRGLTSIVYGSTFSSWLSHATSLMTNVIQNIELKLHDIHIRYEDPGMSCPGSQFAFGLQIKSFTAQTCDNHWKPSHFVATKHEILFKLVELNAFSVYWDTCTEIYADMNLNDLCKKMKDSSIEPHEFILMPSNARVNLKRNCSESSLHSIKLPRIACDLQIDGLELEFRDAQYAQCCKALENLSRLRRRRFNPRRQWKFAGELIIAEIKKKRKVENWPFAIRRVQEIIFYVRFFKEHLINPTKTEEIKLELERIESEFELEELLVLRSIAMRQISKESNVFRRWYNDLSSWWSTEEHWNHFLITHTVVEKRLQNEILEMVDEARKQNLIRKEDMLSVQLSFKLKNGCFRLSSSPKIETTESSNTLLELELLDTAVEVWKSNSIRDWVKLRVIVGNTLIRDRSTIYFQRSLRGGIPLNEAPLFDFVYEKQPPECDWNHRLHATALATEVIYKHSMFLKIKEHFPLPPKERSLLGQKVRKEARSRFKMVKRKATKVLQQTAAILFSQESWDLLINVTAPRIQIVESPFSPIPLTVDLGHFQVNPTNVEGVVAELASLTLNETSELAS